MPNPRRPIAEAKRQRRTAFSLTHYNLTAFPEGVRNLKDVVDLDLSVNGLTRVPEWIGELTQLTRLNLYGNRIEALPESIGNLVNLVELNLGDNQLTSVPASIGRLTALTRVDLDRNRISALPGSIGRLSRLVRLELFANRLTDLPASTARLHALTRLDLGRNPLGALPAPVTELTGLTRLDMSNTGLTELPDSIGRLANLVHLGLDSNRLSSLPLSIAALTKLNRLNLNRNRFTELPEHIGALTELIRLDAENNKLRALPRSITELEHLGGLYIDGNLLPPEYWAAAETGLVELGQLFAGIDVESAPLREAKLVLVGEGEVGKSSLLAAMRGESFDPGRGSTHGIEVKTLETPAPDGDPAQAITLNAWDFGGQKAYRPTHQLFFTAPALYAVVWKARQGPMQGFVDYWIDLVRRRTSDENVTIHIVATHADADGQHPRIDQAAIAERHGDLIGGFHFVDSRTGTGIAELKAALWASAAAIPQINREVPAAWRDLRRSLARSGESYLEYPEYLRRAESFGVDAEAARALAKVATQLGHWIHYPEIDGLENLVVLKGDWLSTAISLVLDDPVTAGRHGLVEHRHLRELWDDPGRPAHMRHDPRFHPALLRLMEKYDISYRISGREGEPGRSLVAQLVDETPPPLAAVWDGFGPHLRQDEQLCEFLDTRGAKALPEGLVHRLIVRWHRRSLGRERYEESVHWHNGFVIQPDPYSRAMVRVEEQRLRISVKAPYPGQFLEVFVSDLDEYVGELWPGFRLKRLVPCGGECLDPDRSRTGLFGLERLLTRRSLGRRTAECRRCWADVPIDDLIHRQLENEERAVETSTVETSTVASRAGGDPELSRAADLSAAEQWAATQREIRKLIALVSDEAARGPRFYTVELRDRRAWHERLTHVGVRVVLWCEHSRLPLYVLDGDPSSGVYEIDVPRDWLVRSAPWIKRSLKALGSILVPGAGLDAILPGIDPSALELHLALAEESLETITELAGEALDGAGEQPWMASDGRSGAELRRLHAFLAQADPGFGGLERVRDLDKYLWVHRSFRSEYEPGPPRFE